MAASLFGGSVYFIGNSNFASEIQVATGGQTVFNLTKGPYTPGANSLGVYVNGLKVNSPADYTESTTTSVTFLIGLLAGDEVQFIYGQQANVSTTMFAPIATVGNYANDAAAAAGGIPVGGFYRNGSILMIRAA